MLYHSDEIWIRNGVRVNPMRKHRKQGGRIFRQCLPLCAISPSTVVIHRPTLQQLGGFDEGLPACEDEDVSAEAKKLANSPPTSCTISA